MKKALLLLICAFGCLSLDAQTITIDHQLPTVAPFAQYQPGIFAVPKTTNGVNDLLNNDIHFNAIRTIDIEEAMIYTAQIDKKVEVPKL